MVDEEQVTRRVTSVPATAPYGGVASDAVTTRTVRRSSSGAEVLRRILVFVFGLIQVVILLRLILLLVNASRGNDLVTGIYNVSSWFVGPFEGILNSNALKQGGSVLDLAAIVALVGWTLLEAIVIAGVNIARREP